MSIQKGLEKYKYGCEECCVEGMGVRDDRYVKEGKVGEVLDRIREGMSSTF